MIIRPPDNFPGEFAKPFDSEECVKIARELFESGTLKKDSKTGEVYGTPPGMVNVVELSHEMHRDYSSLVEVLVDAGWFTVVGFQGYILFPPELRPPGLVELK